MREFRQKQRFRSFLYSVPSLVLLVILTFLLARGAAAIMDKKNESAARLEELESENALLRDRQASLKAGIARLRTEEGIIEAIRSKFNAARFGEHLAVIVEERPKATSTEPGAIERIRRGWAKFMSLWSF